MRSVSQLVFKTSAVVQPTAGLFPRFAFARARGSRAPRARIGWRSWELYFVGVLLRRGRAAPPADAFNPQCFTPPLTTSLRRGAAWARWPSWSSKPVRSCSPRPAFSLASRSLALGARALRAPASVGIHGNAAPTHRGERRGKAAPPADRHPAAPTPPLPTSLRRGAAWARWPSWSSKPVRSCSPRPAFSLASRSLALGARALRAPASVGIHGNAAPRHRGERRGKAAPPADRQPAAPTPPLPTSLRRGAAWARWPSWSSKPVRSCSPRPAFSLASRSLALGARALRAPPSVGIHGNAAPTHRGERRGKAAPPPDRQPAVLYTTAHD